MGIETYAIGLSNVFEQLFITFDNAYYDVIEVCTTDDINDATHFGSYEGCKRSYDIISNKLKYDGRKYIYHYDEDLSEEYDIKIMRVTTLIEEV